MSEKISRFDKDGLTQKQARFAIEYLKDYNGLQAALRAGYAKKGAQVQAHRLLTNDKVAVVISRNREKQRERTRIDADLVLQEIHAVHQMDMIDILDEDGNVLPIRSWPKIWRIMVVGQIDPLLFESGDSQTIKLALSRMKWPDKIKNLELMGRHVGVKAFADVTKVEHGLTDEAATTIKDVLKAIDGKSTGIRQPQPLPEPDDGT